MSQSPREPQIKWRPPQEPGADVPAAAGLPGDKVQTTSPAVPVAPAVSPPSPVPPAVPAPPAPARVAPASPAIPLPPAWVDPDFPVASAPPVVPPPAAAARPSVAPYSAAAGPTPAFAPARGSTAGDADAITDDADLDDEPGLPLTLKAWLRGLSPALATLTVGSIGSAVFLALAMTSHTTPVAVLMSAGVVTGLAFALDTAICTAATYRAGQKGEAGRALVFALLGGVSAVICALALAGTLIMVLVLNSSAASPS